jgi:hypothetical protein
VSGPPTGAAACADPAGASSVSGPVAGSSDSGGTTGEASVSGSGSRFRTGDGEAGCAGATAGAISVSGSGSTGRGRTGVRPGVSADSRLTTVASSTGERPASNTGRNVIRPSSISRAAAASSPALANRVSGSFAIPLVTTMSNPRGRSWRRSDGRGGAALTCACSSVNRSSVGNGRRRTRPS